MDDKASVKRQMELQQEHGEVLTKVAESFGKIQADGDNFTFV